MAVTFLLIPSANRCKANTNVNCSIDSIVVRILKTLENLVQAQGNALALSPSAMHNVSLKTAEIRCSEQVCNPLGPLSICLALSLFYSF